jgi:serine/threonine protein kinase
MKPPNIFVDFFDNLSIGDFGVGKGLKGDNQKAIKKSELANQEEKIIGTPNYMAPEVFEVKDKFKGTRNLSKSGYLGLWIDLLGNADKSSGLFGSK